MMNRLLLLLFSLSPLIWAGCSSSIPETNTYILPTPGLVSETKAGPLMSVSIESIRLADFLDQRGLVIEEGKHRVVITKYHRWAESLKDGIRRCLSRDLNRMGKNFRISEFRRSGDSSQDYLLDFEFDSFHAIGFNTVIASGRWVLRNFQTHEIVKEAYFELSTPVQPQNYEGIVENLAVLLGRLASDVGDAIESLP